MGEVTRRRKAARSIAVDFCAHHPTRSDVEKETAFFERMLKKGWLRIEGEKNDGKGS